MRNGIAFIVVGLLGCSPAGPSSADEEPAVSPLQPQPDAEPDPDATQDTEAGAIEVLMTAATLADDCGGGPNTHPKPSAAPKEKSETRNKGRSDRASRSRARRQCKQSSIQLSVSAPKDAAPAQIVVKSVELLLASGASLGSLQTRSPSVWSEENGYEPWDENVEPGQDLSVTYALTQPDWSQVEDRSNQTYTVKAVVSIAGSDQSVEQNVVVDAPTSLPPNVRT